MERTQNNSDEVSERKMSTTNCGYYTSQIQGQVKMLKTVESLKVEEFTKTKISVRKQYRFEKACGLKLRDYVMMENNQ